MDQVEYFESYRKADLLLHLSASDDDIISRWTYNKEQLSVEKGQEQTEQLFRHKLQIFNENTLPVIKF